MFLEDERLERLPDGFTTEIQFYVRTDSPEALPGALHELARWMEDFDGVSLVRHDPREKVLVVRYDERRGAGEFLRGVLRDRILAARPKPIVRPRLTVLHALPGRLRLRVEGGPPKSVEQLSAFIGQLEGVERARGSPAGGSILVLYDEAVITAEHIIARTLEVDPADWPEAPPPPPNPRAEWVKTGLTTAALATAVTGLAPAPLVYGAIAATAIPTFRRARQSLARKEVNVDVMDATAITVSLLQGQPVTAGIITTLLAVGDLILERTQARARVAISRLMQLDDGIAFVADPDGGAPKRVHPCELAPGMHIVVYPGARVPADGVILEGSLAVDEKALTGESLPRDRQAGERVLAASVALHGQALVEVERAGGDTVASRIVQILEGAGSKPMTLQRNATRVADRLVLPTFGTAGLAWALSGAIDRLTSVLITDFGTGVRVAVPTAALTAMTLAARHGVLVKGATFLERLSEADTIVFDKTGTLTRGEPEVTSVFATSDRFSPRELAAYAAAAEGNQAHPIAEAIRRHALRVDAPEWEPDPQSEYRIGLGLRSRVRGRMVYLGNPRLLREAGIDPSAGAPSRDALAKEGVSSVLLAVDGELAAVIGYADAPRPESTGVVAKLKAGGRRRVLLLSGDARAPVEAIARVVGIDEAIAEVLPEEKVDIVRKLKAEGRKVAMVGDGINDAPALAVADVGISLQGGTEVALETADVVLLEGGLERLPGVFEVADSAMRRVKQVLGLVLVPNALAIAAGALGFLSPVMAAIINNGSTIVAAGHAVAPLLRKSKQT
jgi:Cu2+-exporting ATPase